MNVQLTPEQERIVAEALHSGQYHNASEVLDDALEAFKAQYLQQASAASERLQAIERLRNFGKTHGLSLEPGVTVKGLISEGRR